MFLTDYWYMGAWSAEITSSPIRRIIMNEAVVMYRCSDGTIAALEDRCSHRNYPLSKGVVTGDTVQCGYHGLKFNRSGACIYAPGQDRPPPRAEVRAYPINEVHGVVWIWMGAAEKADLSLIPDLSWLDQPGWKFWAGGYIYLKGRHQYLTENLLDISHLAYVHKSSMGSDPDLIASGKINVYTETFGVRRVTTFENMPTPPYYRTTNLVGEYVGQRVESRIQLGLYQNHVAIQNAGVEWQNEGADGIYPIKLRSFHCIVPETETTTHYFHGGGTPEAVTTVTGETTQKILLEDVDVVESIERNVTLMGPRKNINLRNDLAVMQWRDFLRTLSVDKVL